jgi:NAD(P)-dependent dehydrogenase (short-subunit alcohol dehydrogenase family)
MANLTGKTILVTGGGRGLGAAICNNLALDGANIVVADLDENSARATAEQLKQQGIKAHALRLDVGQSDSIHSALGATQEIFGGLDVVVNNAGTDVTASIEEISETDWERVLRTNLHGPFLLSKYALPMLRKAGAGQIVNICSTAAKRCWPNASAYHASKWGLLGLTHALHAELRSQGIKVTAVIAGGMRTPFLLDRFPDIDPGVLQDPDNVARTVRFLLSLPDESVIPEIMVLPMRETSWP